jgi:hypothetical protein
LGVRQLWAGHHSIHYAVDGARAGRAQGSDHHWLCRSAGSKTNWSERNQGGPIKKVLRRKPEFPFDRFSVIAPIWQGHTVVCFGGGPSLTAEQCGFVERARAGGRPIQGVAINNAYQIAPWSDVNYFADKRWWDWHRERPEFKAFTGQRCTIQNNGSDVDDPDVHIVRNSGTDGLSFDGESLRTGLNSGYQAINLALAAGAERVVLLGYDMKYHGSDRAPAKQRTHWHAGHPEVVGEPMYRVVYASYFNKMKDYLPKGVEIINATPDSYLTCFKRQPLEEVL